MSTRIRDTFYEQAGRKYGRWTITAMASDVRTKQPLALCDCDCGTRSKLIHFRTMRAGTSRSCGCLAQSLRTKHSLSGTPEYIVWVAMRARCHNPKSPNYAYYGGRGIKVCDRWLNDMAAFVSDMGPRPSPNHSIDRKDGNGNYEPGNCRWATKMEQIVNRSATKLSFDKAALIRTMRSTGAKQIDIASACGVSLSGVKSVLCGRAWKQPTEDTK